MKECFSEEEIAEIKKEAQLEAEAMGTLQENIKKAKEEPNNE